VLRLTEAFNARDREGFLGLLADDVEFRNPMGKGARGMDAATEFWRANEEMGVFVEQDGPERVDGERVVVPVVMRMGDGTQLVAAGVFDVRDGKVALFWVVMNRAEVGL
jgi:hypothetical protein